MNELYKLIEKMIRDAGFPKPVDGRDFYNDISDEADEKENGTYMFMIKKEDNLLYKGCMDIRDDDFDLHFVDLILDGQTYHVDFDV
ncbi:MAG: hypothetical protein MJ097_07950 [Dorea sp.]|nr:hypothetical protein [Dorea sp.]